MSAKQIKGIGLRRHKLIVLECHIRKDGKLCGFQASGRRGLQPLITTMEEHITLAHNKMAVEAPQP